MLKPLIDLFGVFGRATYWIVSKYRKIKRPLGHKRWAIAEGCLPGENDGQASEESAQIIGLLNTSDREAKVEINFYFNDREPVGPYRVTVPARRTHQVNLELLSDPEPLPRAIAYASVIESNIPIVVQYARIDPHQAESTQLRTTAYAIKD